MYIHSFIQALVITCEGDVLGRNQIIAIEATLGNTHQSGRFTTLTPFITETNNIPIDDQMVRMVMKSLGISGSRVENIWIEVFIQVPRPLV